MPKYRITDPSTGASKIVERASPPTEDEALSLLGISRGQGGARGSMDGTGTPPDAPPADPPVPKQSPEEAAVVAAMEKYGDNPSRVGGQPYTPEAGRAALDQAPWLALGLLPSALGLTGGLGGKAAQALTGPAGSAATTAAADYAASRNPREAIAAGLAVGTVAKLLHMRPATLMKLGRALSATEAAAPEVAAEAAAGRRVLSFPAATSTPSAVSIPAAVSVGSGARPAAAVALQAAPEVVLAQAAAAPAKVAPGAAQAFQEGTGKLAEMLGQPPRAVMDAATDTAMIERAIPAAKAARAGRDAGRLTGAASKALAQKQAPEIAANLAKWREAGMSPGQMADLVDRTYKTGPAGARGLVRQFLEAVEGK